MLDTKNIKFYTIFTTSILIFGIIYEIFSHQVYSNYMIYAFLIPLLLGIIHIIFNKLLIDELYKMGVITLTVGSIIKGVLDIYGTTNNLVFIYLIGILFIICSMFKKTCNEI